ncbi:hypothetical protein VTJ04DRAFT_2490 [Mycothermus thermophilus]|uniref:uncharacterized protein n=1 Tax=Humicola insolens TaxID=85995 RepID=UPI0037443180
MTSTSRTPTRRSSLTEPSFSATPSIIAGVSATITTRRSILVRTPGSQARGPRPSVTAATPHARAAQRALDSRRAALLTPHRARRRSVREVRDSPRDFLLSLGRVLAGKSKRITTSSSSTSGTSSPATRAGDEEGDEPTLGEIHSRVFEDDDDDEEALPKRPRLSLPIGDEEDTSGSEELQPHRSMIIDDDNNFTLASIEMPRRELPGGQRFSMGNVTSMSDYFNTNDMLQSEAEGVGVDEGFFPAQEILDEAAQGVTMELASPERIDVEADQRNRDSDFAFELPLGEVNESTFMIAPEVQSSPDRTAAPEDDNEPTSPQQNDFAPLFDQQSDDGYDMDQDQRDFGDVPVPLDEDDEPDVTTHNTTAWTEEPSHVTTAMRISARDVMKRTIRISKHGIEYPSLPPTLVKRLAQNFAKANGANGKIAPDALKAIIQASDWFFEQLGDDLAAYSNHAGRKTIDESDVLTLMKRQRQISPSTTLFSLAQRHLPRELLQELRMPPPVVSKKRRRPKAGPGDEQVT